MHYIRFIIGVLFFIFLSFLLHIKNTTSEFKIKRTITTSIPAETLYKYIHDFEQWPEWNPWIQEDPEMKLTFNKTNSELPSYKWYGKEGSGSVKTITTDYICYCLTPIQYGTKSSAHRLNLPSTILVLFFCFVVSAAAVESPAAVLESEAVPCSGF